MSSVVRYDNVTAISAVDSCDTPDEIHNIPGFRFPLTAQVVRHQNCLDIPDMLMIIWPGEVTEKNLVAARLLALMYVEHQNKGLVDVKLSSIFLKADHFDREGVTVQIAFYELLKVTDEDKE